ncbi:hypothetical protein EAG18_02105 [Pseudoalteromonas sp. J010]|uniref:Type VI secretion system protein ImpL n=1 Tax=Pseudoalteromonas peptidolytica F12-50-A1 TaxID=1315280 RepID=A0A8I0MT06_9GAMM|nr:MULTISPECIES: ImcF-related family protein [Pseudoalteromonas]MBE0344714.1 type VI secretion system protein ImpL [Pseudoalteromonas peptidolytica F12-50-A1]NLR14443.1 hypothetical protein [Pseudoalteromonas peptidolytica]RRS10373.1 hypothetical protein EAG18_02105 [Pseudoalteromonas sp. J010]GEK08131.1 type VI secretion protein VasK [Pseudoalteromonas peptidolytica]
MKTPLARLWIGASIMLLAMLLVIMTFLLTLATHWYWLGALLALVSLLVIYVPSINRFVVGRYQRRNFFKQYSTLYQRIAKKLKLSGNIYKTAWYLVISEGNTSDSFAQFNRVKLNGMPANITVYHVQGALIWHVQAKVEEQQHFLAWLSFIRAKQPLNGVLLLSDAFSVIQRSQKAKQEFIADFKARLESIYLRSGYPVPAHLFLCGINKLDGIAESLNERVELADLSIYFSEQGLQSSQALSEAYDLLFKKLFANNLQQVSLQLDDEFKRKQLLGPMQLQYLKLAVSHFIDELADFNGQVLPYKIESFHLVESEGGQQRVNLATAHTLIEVNQSLLPVVAETTLKPKAEITKTFTNQVLPLAHLAPVNKWKIWRHSFRQLVMLGTAGAVLTGSAWIGWQAYDYNQSLHQEFSQLHQDYKYILNKEAISFDELDSLIEPLTLLQSGYRAFSQSKAHKPWYVFPFLASIDREEHYRDLYQQQLATTLEPTLSKYLEQELFVYLELEDYLNVINVKDIYLSFAQAENKAQVEKHLAKSLAQSGMLDDTQIQTVLSLIDDLYLLGYNKIDTNEELLALIDSQLALQDTNQLMYEYVKQLPEFAKLIDIRPTLLAKHNNHVSLFGVSRENTQFLVPELFTPKALQQLSFLPESAFMQKLVQDNHGLFQQTPSKRELARIGNYIKFSYINDYISFWRQYYSGIHLVPELSLEVLLSELTESEQSPLLQLYTTLRAYVYVQSIDVPSTEQSQVSAANAPKKLAAKVQKAQQLADKANATLNKALLLEIEQAKEFNEIAGKIRQAFSSSPILVQSADVLAAEYQVFVAELKALKDWKAQADSTVFPGQTYFEQLNDPTNFKDFSGLWLSRYDEPLMAELVEQVLRETTTHVKRKVSEYLQQQWQQDVVTPYRNNVAAYYPFNKSGEDLKLSALAAFFAPNSAISDFDKQILAQFVTVGDVLELPVFGRQASLTIAPDVTQFLSTYRQLQQTLYGQDGNLKFTITVAPKAMSAALSEFLLRVGERKLSYTHGPLVETQFVWPENFSEQSLQLILTDLNNQKLTQTFEGVWSPMRLIERFQQHTGQDAIEISTQQGASVVFNIKGAGDNSSLLSPEFFARLSVPSTVLQ